VKEIQEKSMKNLRKERNIKEDIGKKKNSIFSALLYLS